MSLVLLVLLPWWGCGDRQEKPGMEGTVTVFGAASTADVLTELAGSYETETGTSVRLSFASSSILARQIEAGAGADLFISANPIWMDYLEERGRLRPGTRIDLLGNRLVLIAYGKVDPPTVLEEVPAWWTGRLAMGDPGHVPAGMYARQALKNLGWWSELSSRIVPAEDVRAALRFVEMGEVGLGIVYATDVPPETSLQTLFTFPTHIHDPVRYPIALCPDTGEPALRFYHFLLSPQAEPVFRRFGFERLRQDGAGGSKQAR